MHRFPIKLLLLALAWSGPAVAAESPSTSLTIYSKALPGAVSPDQYRPVAGRNSTWYGAAVPGYAVVRQDRTVTIARGRGSLAFTDVAALIDPTTVRFRSLSDRDGTRVLEQDFRFDLVGTDRLLERYLDRRITVYGAGDGGGSTLSGKLLSTSGGIVLGMPDGKVEVVRDYRRISFPELPGGLITRPTLVWDITSKRGGVQRTRVAYETGGITWWADYNLTWQEGDDPHAGSLDVGAWVSIVNQSGAGYEDARLKLIAGDVQRAAEPDYAETMRRQVMMAAAPDVAGFEQKSFFEFHLYTLGRPVTLPDRSTKQIELFPAVTGVPARKTLVYAPLGRFGAMTGEPRTARDFGLRASDDVDVYLQFRNTEENGLGMPLPAGRLRVSRPDTGDDSLEFIGEDILDHTPRNEEVRLRLGTAFDVIGDRVQTDFRVDSRGHWLEEEIEITLTNRKQEPAEVIVREPLYRWTNWEILSSSERWEKTDAANIRFALTVPADGERTLRYRARYTW